MRIDGTEESGEQAGHDVAFMKRGPIDSVLRLLQQEEITRGKALEMLAHFALTSELPENAPWDKLNWADDVVLVPATQGERKP